MNIRGIAYFFCLIISTHIYGQAVSSASIQDLLIGLTSSEDSARLSTLERIVNLDNPESAANLLSQYKNSNLYLWKGMIIGTSSVTEDENYNKLLTPTDPLTGFVLKGEGGNCFAIRNSSIKTSKE